MKLVRYPLFSLEGGVLTSYAANAENKNDNLREWILLTTLAWNLSKHEEAR